MTHQEAQELLRDAVPAPGGGGQGPVASWADLGAGAGTFTLALARLLGDDARVLAVDRDPAALRRLRRRSKREGWGRPGGGAEVVTVQGDLREPASLPGLREAILAGALFANALHFDASPAETLARYRDRLGAGGRVVVVEYHGRRPGPWVPHPLPPGRLREVAAAAGLGPPRLVAERPSAYGGVIYCAWLAAVSTPPPHERR